MDTHTHGWNEGLDAVTRKVTERFGPLNSNQLNYKPDASTWSIAQILEHLVSINKSYHSNFDKLLDGTHSVPWTGKFNFIVHFFGRTILKSVQPDTTRKAKTLLIWEPSSSNIDKEVLFHFESSQKVLKEYITKLQNHVDAHTVISSPANKFVVYTLPMALDIILAHEKRHFQQAIALIYT